ncbi:hypothetical protein YC2023_008793 [Brassica napus]
MESFAKPARQFLLDFVLYCTSNHLSYCRALLAAMGVSYKPKNLAIAYNFARRFFGTNPNTGS